MDNGRLATRRERLCHETWPELRYGPLLRSAAASRAAGRRYAHLVAAVELLDARRRRAALARIERWLATTPRRALRIFHASLVSEAREEADSAFFMRHPLELDGYLPAPGALPRPDGPVLYATLHLGSPILAYLFLRTVARTDVRAIGRRLDERNPMPPAKRRYGLAKEAWLRRLAGVELVAPSAHAMIGVRDHLLDGRHVLAALDVPGDVVAHSTRLDVAGEEVAFSAGAVRIARLAQARVVPLVALAARDGLRLHAGPPLATSRADATVDVLRALLGFVHRFPDEWWLWPYVRAAA